MRAGAGARIASFSAVSGLENGGQRLRSYLTWPAILIASSLTGLTGKWSQKG